MDKNSNNKRYNLEDRTLKFTKNTRDFLKNIKKDISNLEYVKQVIRSSASIGANYIEANECLGKKDFKMRIKISKKEAKETRYWLKLLDCNNEQNLEKRRAELIQETNEFMKIFGAILEKSK